MRRYCAIIGVCCRSLSFKGGTQAHLEAEHDIEPGRPAGESRPPYVGRTDSDPLHLPELIEIIQHHATLDLVDVIDVEPCSEVAEEIGALEPTAAAQLVSEELDTQRDIDVDHRGDRFRVPGEADIRVGAIEALGVVVDR